MNILYGLHWLKKYHIRISTATSWCILKVWGYCWNTSSRKHLWTKETNVLHYFQLSSGFVLSTGTWLNKIYIIYSLRSWSSKEYMLFPVLFRSEKERVNNHNKYAHLFGRLFFSLYLLYIIWVQLLILTIHAKKPSVTNCGTYTVMVGLEFKVY